MGEKIRFEQFLSFALNFFYLIFLFLFYFIFIIGAVFIFHLSRQHAQRRNKWRTIKAANGANPG